MAGRVLISRNARAWPRSVNADADTGGGADGDGDGDGDGELARVPVVDVRIEGDRIAESAPGLPAWPSR